MDRFNSLKKGGNGIAISGDTKKERGLPGNAGQLGKGFPESAAAREMFQR